MSFIVGKNLEKRYDKTTVFKNINFNIKKGEFVTLLGPSGCGKSTLLRCIAGLNDVNNGDIYIDGENVTDKSAKDRGIGMVFQNYALFPNMTVFENIAFGLEMKKLKKGYIEKKVDEMLKLVHLEEKRDFYPGQLSGGQKQRVAIARSLATEPKILLLDEPLSALDAKVRKSLREQLKEIQKETNVTTIFVTHDQEEALTISDRVFIMDKGDIVQVGTPEEIYTNPKTVFMAQFIGNYNILKDEETRKVFGNEIFGNIAIRPEAIYVREIERNYNLDDFILKKGIVKDFSILGNVIRYFIECKGVSLRVDLLNRGLGKLYEIGSVLDLMFLKKEIKYY
ncbi:ABC transporter ATP-binding protein [Cetobacterium sp.]|uniref:ABC transporter ATP-binding protein n=2 Tax=Cetobacterium sp. TaxID=2071632 RepID=UPI003EE74483